MEKLKRLVETILIDEKESAFSIYHCQNKQEIHCVPILKPVLVFVLSGEKLLGGEINESCQAGQFVLLAENPDVSITNLPQGRGYLALFIELEADDFLSLTTHRIVSSRHMIGNMDELIIQCLSQYIEWCLFAPKSMWALRRKELIHLLYSSGFEAIAGMMPVPQVHHKVIDILKSDLSIRWDINMMSAQLAMSESTLRRRLQKVGTSFSELNIKIRLAYGMHLLQTTSLSISVISEQCGYSSQSRFTEKFRDRFNITPSALRKTKVH